MPIRCWSLSDIDIHLMVVSLLCSSTAAHALELMCGGQGQVKPDTITMHSPELVFAKPEFHLESSISISTANQSTGCKLDHERNFDTVIAVFDDQCTLHGIARQCEEQAGCVGVVIATEMDEPGMVAWKYWVGFGQPHSFTTIPVLEIGNNDGKRLRDCIKDANAKGYDVVIVASSGGDNAWRRFESSWQFAVALSINGAWTLVGHKPDEAVIPVDSIHLTILDEIIRNTDQFGTRCAQSTADDTTLVLDVCHAA